MEKNRAKKSSLWLLGLSPLVWALHFLFSYVIAAIWCAKVSGRGGDLSDARIAIGIATFIAFAVIIIEIVLGAQKFLGARTGAPSDADDPENREAFLGLSRLLIASLSFVSISYTAYVGWFFRSCV